MTTKTMKRRRAPKSTMKRCSTKLISTLKRLSKLPSSQLQRQIQLANHKFVNDLCAATRKLRYAKIKLTPTLRKKLTRHRQHLRSLANRRTSVQTKKKLLTQRGGVLPFLIPLIVAGISAAGSVGAAAVHGAVSRA